MHSTFTIMATLALLGGTFGIAITTPQTQAAISSPQPIYHPHEYVPHSTYPNAETYPNPAYDFLIPAGPVYQPDYLTSLMPAPQTALQYVAHFALKIVSKIGLFLAGGVALLVVGGIFTTAVCSLTPICTITFNTFGGLNKEVMKSYMTPDNIQAAASLVEEAIGKYDRMQRAVKPKQ